MDYEPREFPDPIKRQAFLRSGGWCQGFARLCLQRWPTYDSPGVEYDHVKRWTDGGPSTLDNCQVLCTECHTRKSSNETFVAALLRGAFTAPSVGSPGARPTLGEPSEPKRTWPTFGSWTSFPLPD